MRTLKVKDVMTREVISVHEDTSFKAVAAALSGRGISGMPVLTPIGEVVGVVSEADLLPNEYRAGEHDQVHDLLHRGEARKADARTAKDLMNAPAITVTPDIPVRKAAALMARHGVKRLPVVDERGLLVGIVSRRDVIGTFLRSDEDIQAEVEQEVFLRGMATDPRRVGIQVQRGVVTLSGRLERKSWVALAESLVHNVAGVVDVENTMTYEQDDEKIRLLDPVDGTRYREW